MMGKRDTENDVEAYYKDLFRRCSELMQTIRFHVEQPVVAEVDGVATAAGCQLVATCDLVVCSRENSKFGVNGIDVGLFCSTPAVALTRSVGGMPTKHAFELLATGAMIDAGRALELGLVNRVVPSRHLKEETEALAGEIASKLGSAVGLGKRAFYKQLEMPSTDEAYRCASEAIVKNLMQEPTQECIAKFLKTKGGKAKKA